MIDGRAGSEIADPKPITLPVVSSKNLHLNYRRWLRRSDPMLAECGLQCVPWPYY